MRHAQEEESPEECCTGRWPFLVVGEFSAGFIKLREPRADYIKDKKPIPLLTSQTEKAINTAITSLAGNKTSAVGLVAY